MHVDVSGVARVNDTRGGTPSATHSATAWGRSGVARIPSQRAVRDQRSSASLYGSAWSEVRNPSRKMQFL
jgi:hypothetical protein